MPPPKHLPLLTHIYAKGTLVLAATLLDSLGLGAKPGDGFLLDVLYLAGVDGKSVCHPRQ